MSNTHRMMKQETGKSNGKEIFIRLSGHPVRNLRSNKPVFRQIPTHCCRSRVAATNQNITKDFLLCHIIQSEPLNIHLCITYITYVSLMYSVYFLKCVAVYIICLLYTSTQDHDEGSQTYHLIINKVI